MTLLEEKSMPELLSDYFEALVKLENTSKDDESYPEVCRNYQKVSDVYMARISRNVNSHQLDTIEPDQPTDQNDNSFGMQ